MQPANWGVMEAGPASAAQLAERANDSYDAILTWHSGATRPAYLTYGPWIKEVSTTVHQLLFFVGDDTDVLLGTLDPVSGSIVWEVDATTSVRVIYASSEEGLNPGETEYFGPRGRSIVEAEQSFSFPFAATMRNLRVHANPAPGAAQAIVVTLRLNHADTLLTAVISATAQGGSNTLEEVVIAAGDVLSFEVQASVGAAASAIAISAELEIAP